VWVIVRGQPFEGPWAWVVWFAAAAVAANQILIVRYYRLTQSDPRYAPTYILGSLVAAGMLVTALSKVGGKTRTVWRGTVYRGDAREDGASHNQGADDSGSVVKKLRSVPPVEST